MRRLASNRASYNLHNENMVPLETRTGPPQINSCERETSAAMPPGGPPPKLRPPPPPALFRAWVLSCFKVLYESIVGFYRVLQGRTSRTKEAVRFLYYMRFGGDFQGLLGSPGGLSPQVCQLYLDAEFISPKSVHFQLYIG